MGFQIEKGVLVKYTEEKGLREVMIPKGVVDRGDDFSFWWIQLFSESQTDKHPIKRAGVP